jgi:hypothetical protein
MQELITIMEDSQDFFMLFKIPSGTWKNFFEIHKQFGCAPSERFVSPALPANLLHIQWELPQYQLKNEADLPCIGT